MEPRGESARTRPDDGLVAAREVAERFESVHRDSEAGWQPRIRSESELPYRKATIRSALLTLASSSAEPSERARWAMYLRVLEHFLPDADLEPYWVALEHERECIRIMGRVNERQRLDPSHGLAPADLRSYERHVAGAVALRPLRERIAAAVQRVTETIR